jgi:glycosyltransferase involved in cell wall biosynthesis
MGKKLNRQAGEAKTLSQLVTALETELAAVYSSRSWRITAPLRASYRGPRWLLWNTLRLFKLLGWLGTGQFNRAGQALLPYYERYVPLRVKEMVPDRVRLMVRRQFIGKAVILSQKSGKIQRRNWPAPALPHSSRLARNVHFLIYDVSSDILRENWALIKRFREDPHLELNRVLWILPSFDHIYRGGIYTIFRVADRFSRQFGTANTIVLHGGKTIPLPEVETMIRKAFPSLKFQLTALSSPEEADGLPPSDAAFCTFWTTAYVLVRYNKCRGKFYFVQDFEPAFYTAGSTYGLIEQTYRFGFNGVANTPGVGELYRQYNPWVQYFVPGIDKSIFHPDPERSTHKGTWRIVFYGRPHNVRNAFELGVTALSLVKNELGDAVEILSAGSDFSESAYGIKGILTNLGVLQSLEELAALYRSCDAGLVFMYTAHPSYQPFEFMASGCATISNFNRYTQWFLRDGENAALSHSTPTCIAERILEVLRDEELRHRIVEGGLKTVSALEWDAALDRISKFVCHPSPSRSEFVPTDTHL